MGNKAKRKDQARLDARIKSFEDLTKGGGAKTASGKPVKYHRPGSLKK